MKSKIDYPQLNHKFVRSTPDVFITLLSPEDAELLWSTANKRNRTATLGRKESFVSKINDNKFFLTPDCIGILSTGHVVSGQKRLWACMQTGKPILVGIMMGISPESVPVIDIGQVKTPKNVIEMETGKKCVAFWPCLAKGIERLENNYTNSETDCQITVDSFYRHEKIIKLITNIISTKRAKNANLYKAGFGIALANFYIRKPVKALAFAELVIETGEKIFKASEGVGEFHLQSEHLEPYEKLAKFFFLHSKGKGGSAGNTQNYKTIEAIHQWVSGISKYGELEDRREFDF